MDKDLKGNFILESVLMCIYHLQINYMHTAVMFCDEWWLRGMSELMFPGWVFEVGKMTLTMSL